MHKPLLILNLHRIPKEERHQTMVDNLGSQATSAVDEKILEIRALQEELNALRSDLGTLMAQRNENEMVKQVGASVCACVCPRIHCLHLLRQSILFAATKNHANAS